jgi:hypothetical protein
MIWTHFQKHPFCNVGMWSSFTCVCRCIFISVLLIVNVKRCVCIRKWVNVVLQLLVFTILYLSILLHFYNTIHIKSLHKTFSICRATLYHSDFAVYTTCFSLYRPSSGVLLIVAKTVTRVAICPLQFI